MIDVTFHGKDADDRMIVPCEDETLALQVASSGLLNTKWDKATFNAWEQDFVLTSPQTMTIVSLFVQYKPHDQYTRWYDAKSETFEVAPSNAKEMAWNIFLLDDVACVSGTINGKDFMLATDEHVWELQNNASTLAVESMREDW